MRAVQKPDDTSMQRFRRNNRNALSRSRCPPDPQVLLRKSALVFVTYFVLAVPRTGRIPKHCPGQTYFSNPRRRVRVDDFDKNYRVVYRRFKQVNRILDKTGELAEADTFLFDILT